MYSLQKCYKVYHCCKVADKDSVTCGCGVVEEGWHNASQSRSEEKDEEMDAQGQEKQIEQEEKQKTGAEDICVNNIMNFPSNF